MTLEKIHPIEKQQFCEKVYMECLVDSAEMLSIYELYANTVEVLLPCGCYTNFRDALFHFRKLVSSSEEKEIENQQFAMKEHLSRALTDAASSILDHASFVAEKILVSSNLDEVILSELRSKLHEMKQAILRKRFAGMMFSSEETVVSHKEIVDIIDVFYGFVNSNCRYDFARFSREYGVCKSVEMK